MRELDQARKMQAEAKKAMMAREASLQQQEYDDALKYSMGVVEREKREKEAKEQASKEHRDMIMEQIAYSERTRKSKKAEKYEEGRRLVAVRARPLHCCANRASGWVAVVLVLVVVAGLLTCFPVLPAGIGGCCRLKNEFAAEKAKLEAIRDHMVGEMLKKGVNPKYLAEMKATDINKMMMR